MGLGNLLWNGPGRRIPARERVIGALLAASPLALLPAPASAQVATENAQAEAVLLDRGLVVKVTDIDFGEIAMPNVPGTIVLTPSASATCITSAGIIRTGTCQAAEFAVMERKHNRIRIRNQSGNSIVLTGPGGATMTMTNITHSVAGMTSNPGGGPPDMMGRYRIDTDSGIAYFWIGGRLNIGANQAAGVYTGQITIMTQLN